jgi:hypothetical protein
MSLATVADVVFFKAPLMDGPGTALCAADLRADSVRIGDWKFSGSMRLSDTSSVTFVNHRVPRGRYLLVADAALRCTSSYQRCWFHLFLADVYLARLERLHQIWDLPRSAEQIVTLNELALLRAYALRLLDDVSFGSDIQALHKASSAIKLRVSLMAQATMASLHGLESLTPAAAARLRADGSELGYLRHQPTADEAILRSLGVQNDPIPRPHVAAA